MTNIRSWVRVAHIDDLPEGEMLAVMAEGQRIALYHLESGRIVASDNVCTHEFALLTDGWLEGCEVECPLHAGRFDLRDGRALCAPAIKDLTIYEVMVIDGAIHVDLPTTR